MAFQVELTPRLLSFPTPFNGWFSYRTKNVKVLTVDRL